jgi:HlyD family secretion protein
MNSKIIFVSFLFVFVAFCSADDHVKQGSPKPDPGSGSNPSTPVRATGMLEPDEVFEIRAPVSGEIIALGEDPRQVDKKINIGSKVEKGAILAKIDSKLYESAKELYAALLESANASAEAGKASLQADEELIKRLEKLVADKAVDPSKLDDARAQRDKTKAKLASALAEADKAAADLKNAEKVLEGTIIRSPCQGIIVKRNIKAGQTVIAGRNTPVLFVVAKDLKKLKIVTTISDEEGARMKQGQSATFVLDDGSKDTFKAKVNQIRTESKGSAILYTVVLDVDNSDGKLQPYQKVNLTIQSGDEAKPNGPSKGK